MGLYDTVTFNCPCCGERFDEQTKSGESKLKTYTIYNAPANVIGGLCGPQDVFTCKKGTKFRIQGTFRLEVILGDEV